ncbi:OmpA family protein [Novosphingobium sp. 9]|uniref:OmpA family protein n=1 Tax=Novosphingobium sp. 9 TaxID=2025349 RepID=UPI0021B66622|nr:OmpA family protein [Novosphingobium sp. 9]
MNARRLALVAVGAALSLALALMATRWEGPVFVAGLAAKAAAVRDEAGGKGIAISFRDRYGVLTRHPTLSGGKGLSPDVRRLVAERIADVPGIGGVSWANDPDGSPQSLHCQDDVEAILRTRSIRFSQNSAHLDPASNRPLDEVAKALHPCVGSIIAVTGHTNATGNEAANIELSRARAEAVRWSLIGRGIPADGLRATGMGAARPLPGLDPLDPANRRIEFSVIASAPVKPTPIDTPGPG